MQEPISEVSEPSDALEKDSDVNTPPTSESVKLKRKTDPVKTPGKKIKKEAAEIGGQEEKIKPPKVKLEKDVYSEPPRAEVLPDRTNSDFYCKVCDAHMNSIQVWESHIQGKRHLKNVKKETSAPVTVKKEKEEVDDVACLYYIDTTGAQSPSADYITTIGVSSPSPDLMDTGEVEAESPCSDFVHTGETGAESPSVDTHMYERPLSPADSNSRAEREYSPEPSSSLSAGYVTSADSDDPMMAAFMRLNTFERLDYLRELSESLEPQSENDVNEIKSIIAAFFQAILQYEIRQLPFAAQQKLAKELFRK